MAFRFLPVAGALMALALTVGRAEPISANKDQLRSPRVGLSSKEDVINLWGKPASEKVEGEYSVCTWRRHHKTFTLKFNTKLDVLVDRKVAKNPSK